MALEGLLIMISFLFDLVQPPVFIEEVTALRQTEMEVTLKAKQLTMMRIDATNVDAVKQLKGILSSILVRRKIFTCYSFRFR